MTAAVTLAGLLPEEALGACDDPGRWGALGGVPEAVASPQTAEEAAAVLAWASREGVGVVPAGSGRWLGPRRMSGRFVVLTSDRLSGVEIYEPADLTFTAKSGTSMSEIDSALGSHHQWLPFNPPAVLARSLGGLVASGASGPLWMGYGPVRNHVLGATVATGDGRVLRLGGRVVKNVAGFDLLKPMVGSRGTLAFITSVCMRAFPRPATNRSLVLRADGLGGLVEAASSIGTAPVLPVSSVLSAGGPGSGAELRVRLHGARPTVDADQKTLEVHLGVAFDSVDEDADVVVGGDSAPEGEPVAGETPRDGAPWTVLEATVLPSHLDQAVAALNSVDPDRVTVDTYAARIRVELSQFDALAIGELRSAVERLGGASAVERAPHDADVAGLASRPSAAELTLAARVASAFDPEGVLWRGSTP